MHEALRLAERSLEEGGGPFGAVIVKEGEIIGRGMNRVTLINDPTAHAEIVAIRDACQHLNEYHLVGCQMYVNCYPCPMCLSAVYWAHIDTIYYAATGEDAADAGFADQRIAAELVRPPDEREVKMLQMLPEKAVALFERWKAMPEKIEY